MFKSSAALVVVLLVCQAHAGKPRSLLPELLERLSQSVNPVLDQLNQNVQETLSIWSRPLTALVGSTPASSASASPTATKASPPRRDGSTADPPFTAPKPFLQGLFEPQQQLHDWWKGPNVCIERQEIDETYGTTVTLFGGKPDEEEANEGESKEEETVDEQSTEVSSDRDGRQLKFTTKSHFRISSCSHQGLTYVCETKVRSNPNGIRMTYRTRYACCYGTVRESREFGCHAVEMRSLQETVFALGGRSFLTLMKEAEVDEQWQRQTPTNRTFFVPVDRSTPDASNGDAANDLNTDEMPVIDFTESSENTRQRRQALDEDIDAANADQVSEVRTTVLSHIVPGVYLTTDMQDEQLLASEETGVAIRVNMYNAPDRVYTANCVRMVSMNHYSQQGIVHMLDGAMKPATKTVAQLLQSEAHFESFRNLLGDELLANKLSEPGQFTVFAPTDEAFAKLDEETRQRLNNREGCIHSVVKQHLLPNVICSTVIKGRARTTTMLGSSLLLERDLEGRLYVNGKQVITRDVMATNGVLHVIDGVLIPENARSFSQLLSSRNLTDFRRLVEAAGLITELDSMTNTTLFAPSNDAVRAIPDEVKQAWMADPQVLKKVILNHVSQPLVRQSAVSNNQMVRTRLDGNQLRINLYPSMPLFNGVSIRATAQCAPIVRWEQEACNGNVHVVDRVLMPSTGHITQWLASNRSFSIMTQLLKRTKLAELLASEGPFTVLAAPDVAFYQMPEEQLSEMTRYSERAEEVLRHLIIPEQVCCTGFRGDWFTSNRKRTIDGQWINLQRHLDGHLTVGDAQVLTCDNLASNGVVHVVDKVFSSKTTSAFGSGNRRIQMRVGGRK